MKLRRFSWLLALLAGGGTAFALPPIGFLPVILLFSALLALIRRARSPWGAFLVGWSFGFGFYLSGLYWVAIAFFVEGEKFGPLAIPAVVLLTATMGAIVGLATAVTHKCRLAVPEADAAVLAVAWTLSELVRGNPGLQFPWNPMAIVWFDWPAMMQLQAWIGTAGLSFLTVFLAALPIGLIERRRGARWVAPVVAIVALAALWTAGSWRLDQLPLADAPGTTLRLVQPSIPQEEKMQSELTRQNFERHLQMSGGAGGSEADIVIWAESSVPYAMQRYPEVGEAIARATPGDGWVVVGANYFDDQGTSPIAHNSLWVVDPAGAVADRYDKVDLVPFGEFLPFRSVLGRLGLQGVAAGNVDFRSGPGRRTLELDGLPPFSPLICYEGVYSGGATDSSGRAEWLLNITNDGWFGDSLGPYQHLAMARARAIEEGLPLVRTANNGISVVTDAYGRVLSSLALNEVGTIEAQLPARLAIRPFYVEHQWIIVVLLVGAVLLAVTVNFLLVARPQVPQGVGTRARDLT